MLIIVRLIALVAAYSCADIILTHFYTQPKGTSKHD